MDDFHIDDLFQQMREEGAEELRNELSILIEEALETAWPSETPQEVLEAKWFIEGLKYALLLVNYAALPERYTD
jgi:hypothetical protein